MGVEQSVSDVKKGSTDTFDNPDREQMVELHRKVVTELNLSPEDEEARRAAALEIVRAARSPGKDAEAAIIAAKTAASKIIGKSAT